MGGKGAISKKPSAPTLSPSLRPVSKYRAKNAKKAKKVDDGAIRKVRQKSNRPSKPEPAQATRASLPPVELPMVARIHTQ